MLASGQRIGGGRSLTGLATCWHATTAAKSRCQTIHFWLLFFDVLALGTKKGFEFDCSQQFVLAQCPGKYSHLFGWIWKGREGDPFNRGAELTPTIWAFESTNDDKSNWTWPLTWLGRQWCAHFDCVHWSIGQSTWPGKVSTWKCKVAHLDDNVIKFNNRNNNDNCSTNDPIMIEPSRPAEQGFCPPSWHWPIRWSISAGHVVVVVDWLVVVL